MIVLGKLKADFCFQAPYVSVIKYNLIHSLLPLNVENILGKTPYLYRHDLVALSQRNLTQKISRPMNKIPEKYLPKKLAITTRLPETKYVLGSSHNFDSIVFSISLIMISWWIFNSEMQKHFLFLITLCFNFS